MLKLSRFIKKNLFLVILATGFAGIIAQIVILRELLVSFFGNEFSIGIILANWLILEALGAYVFRKKAERSNKKIEFFIFLQILFSIFLPLTIYFSRTFKTVSPFFYGQGVGFIPLFLSSFFILLPVSLIHGALFAFLSQIFRSFNEKGEKFVLNKESKSIGMVYVLETVGTLIGGLVFTYLLLPKFNSLQIGFGTSIVNMILCFIFFISYFPKAKGKYLSTKFAGVFLIIVLVSFVYVIFSNGNDKLRKYSINKQWHSQNVVYYHNSKYGNIAVTKNNEQYNFFLNGIPSITVPVTDIVSVEEFVHFSMLSHLNPKKILVIGDGVGGVINEILKYKVEDIDYVELDPDLFKAVKKFSTPLTDRELNNDKVNIVYKDGRLFVKQTSKKYDIIFVGVSMPVDLQINRLFTSNFFNLAKNKLNNNGILVLSLPGSLSYMNEELKNLNVCILDTLKQVYPFVKVIPGDLNIFLASSNKNIKNINSKLLNSRLNSRNIETKLLVPGYLDYKLSFSHENWFYSNIKALNPGVNRDFKPIGVYYSLVYWNTIFSPYINNFFSWVRYNKIWFVVFLISFFILILAVVYLKNKILLSKMKIEVADNKMYKLLKTSVPYLIITTGFSGMIFQIMLILTFQVIYGYVYYWIGILIAVFMTGMAVGGYYVTCKLNKIKESIKLLLKMEVAVIIFTLMLPLIFSLLKGNLDNGFGFVKFIFLILCFFAGGVVGVEFPLANKVYLNLTQIERENGVTTGTVGLLYGSDLFGGWIGGIIGAVILLPILGLIATSLTMISIKISSFIILLSVYMYNRKYVEYNC